MSYEEITFFPHIKTKIEPLSKDPYAVVDQIMRNLKGIPKDVKIRRVSKEIESKKSSRNNSITTEYPLKRQTTRKLKRRNKSTGNLNSPKKPIYSSSLVENRMPYYYAFGSPFTMQGKNVKLVKDVNNRARKEITIGKGILSSLNKDLTSINKVFVAQRKSKIDIPDELVKSIDKLGLLKKIDQIESKMQGKADVGDDVMSSNIASKLKEKIVDQVTGIKAELPEELIKGVESRDRRIKQNRAKINLTLKSTSEKKKQILRQYRRFQAK